MSVLRDNLALQSVRISIKLGKMKQVHEVKIAPGGGAGGPAGRPEEAAVGEGGGEGEGGQGGGLARLHHRQEHREEGEVLGLLETGGKESFQIDV